MEDSDKDRGDSHSGSSSDIVRILFHYETFHGKVSTFISMYLFAS